MSAPAGLHEYLMLPVAALAPYARNARTHSPAQVAQIAASIREFGWTNPVLIDADNGIIAGHGRVLAAQSLGMARVQCLRLSHLTPAQARAYVLADNQLSLNAGWDEALLAGELQALDIDGFDLALTGFSPDDIEAYLDDLTVIGGGHIDESARRQTNNLGIVGKGANVGLTFGDIMVTVPRDVYAAVADCVARSDDDARDVVVALLLRGVAGA